MRKYTGIRKALDIPFPWCMYYVNCWPKVVFVRFVPHSKITSYYDICLASYLKNIRVQSTATWKSPVLGLVHMKLTSMCFSCIADLLLPRTNSSILFRNIQPARKPLWTRPCKFLTDNYNLTMKWCQAILMNWCVGECLTHGRMNTKALRLHRCYKSCL